MKRVLVAGATGYLGQHVVNELRKQGYWVRALARPGKQVKGADETFQANATEAGELDGVCEDIDVVFSSLGITRQTDKVTYHDVDYGANHHLLMEALRSNVKRFLFVSVVKPELFAGNEMVAAREKLVAELEQAAIEHCVVRATGFFSDMTEMLHMAQKGRVYLIGNGENHMNPIHGEDLASVCVAAINDTSSELVIGGPEVMTYNELAHVAFQAVGKNIRITHIPMAITRRLLALTKLISRRAYTIASFMATATSNKIVGEPSGDHLLLDYYQDVISSIKQ